MKHTIRLFAATFLAGLLAMCGSLNAGQDPSNTGKTNAAKDAKALLEKGQASNALPDGMVVRIGACLGGADEKAAGGRDLGDMREMWEFTSNEVHRVVAESKGNKLSYHRVESRPFDSSAICKELLDGKAIEIQARKGEGPEMGFVGTDYRAGSRSIEVEWQGESILDLGETNGPMLVLYHETDARAFGALYERLAGQVRSSFKLKP